MANLNGSLIVSLLLLQLSLIRSSLAQTNNGGWSIELPQNFAPNSNDDVKRIKLADQSNGSKTGANRSSNQDNLFDDSKDIDTVTPPSQSLHQNHRMDSPTNSNNNNINFSAANNIIRTNNQASKLPSSQQDWSKASINRWIPYPMQPDLPIISDTSVTNADIGQPQQFNLVAQDPLHQTHPPTIDLTGAAHITPIPYNHLVDLIPNTARNYVTLDSLARVVAADRNNQKQTAPFSVVPVRPNSGLAMDVFVKQLETLKKAHAPLFDGHLLHNLLLQQESLRRQAYGYPILNYNKNLLKSLAPGNKRRVKSPSGDIKASARSKDSNDSDNDLDRIDSLSKDPYKASFSSPAAFYDVSSALEGRSSKLVGDESHIDQFFTASPRYSAAASHMMPMYYAAYPNTFGHKLSARHSGLEKSVLIPILIGIGAALISFLIISNLFLSIPLLAMTLFSFFNTNQMMTMPHYTLPQPNNNNQPVQPTTNGKRRRRRDLNALRADLDLIDSLERLKFQ